MDDDLGAFTPGDDFGYDDSWLVDPSQLYQPGGGYTDPYESTYPTTGVGDGGYTSPGYTGGVGGGGFDVTKLLKSLGLSIGKGDDASSLLPLLSLLGIGTGAFMKTDAQKDATKLMTDALAKSSADASTMFGEQRKLYEPYNAMGAGAAAALPGMVYKPIAGNFKPLGSGAALNLGNIMKKG